MRGGWIRRDVLVLPEFPVVAKGLAFPTLADNLRTLAHARSALLQWDPPAVVLHRTVALHETETKASAGHQVDDGRFFGHQNWIVQG